MQVAPTFDVRPVDRVLLHGYDVSNVGYIFLSPC